MSKTRKIILISLLNITIVLWLSLIYSVITHKEDEALVNYKSKEEVKEKPKKLEPEKEPNLFEPEKEPSLEDEFPDF